MKLRHFCIVVSLALLAPVSYAADPVVPPATDPSATEPQPPAKNGCSLPCLVMKVSTRCECRLHKTLPTVARA
jgi:hypothetical protein